MLYFLPFRYPGDTSTTQGIKTNLADLAKLAIYAQAAAERVNNYRIVYIQTMSGNVYKISLNLRGYAYAYAHSWYIENGRDRYLGHYLEDISELEIGQIFSYQYTHSSQREIRNTTPIAKLIVVEYAATNADFSQYSNTNIVDAFVSLQRLSSSERSSGKINNRSMSIFGALKKWFGDPTPPVSSFHPTTQTLSSPPLSFNEELIQEQFIIERLKRTEAELKLLEEQGKRDKKKAEAKAEVERQNLLKTIYERVHEQLKTRQLLETLNQRIYGGKGNVLLLHGTAKATLLLQRYDPGIHEMSSGSFYDISRDVEYFCSGYVLNEDESINPNIFVGFVNQGCFVDLGRFVVSTSWDQIAQSVCPLRYQESFLRESNLTTISLPQAIDAQLPQTYTELLQSSFIESTLTSVYQSLRDIAKEHFQK